MRRLPNYRAHKLFESIVWITQVFRGSNGYNDRQTDGRADGQTRVRTFDRRTYKVLGKNTIFNEHPVCALNYF